MLGYPATLCTHHLNMVIGPPTRTDKQKSFTCKANLPPNREMEKREREIRAASRERNSCKLVFHWFADSRSASTPYGWLPVGCGRSFPALSQPEEAKSGVNSSGRTNTDKPSPTGSCLPIIDFPPQGFSAGDRFLLVLEGVFSS